jgi:Bacterial transcriptional activator domain/AAA ATPase domain
VRELLRRARLAAAEAALATGSPQLAAVYAEAAIAADPLDEAAHRWYMSASVAAGEQAKALAAYEALRQRLGRELGADPAPQTRELHLAILREQDGSAASAGHRRPTPGSPRLGGPKLGGPKLGGPKLGGPKLGGPKLGGPKLGGPKPGGPALAGRERETRVLREAWSMAAAGQPGLVTIVGEAGIGKTALAELRKPASRPVAPGCSGTRPTCRWRRRGWGTMIRNALHDMGDPLTAAKHIRQALKPDGTWLIVEPNASDEAAGNMNPLGRAYYSFSTLLCVPNALSQPGGYALGAQAGEAAIRQVATDAGFTRFRRAAEAPLNLVYEVRP